MLDKNGYKRKTYDELWDEIQDRTKQLYGEDTNVGEKSFIGILIRIMAWFLSLVWKDNEDVYYSSNLDDATGRNLDRILPRYGISRNFAENAIGIIQITGTPNYIVPSGFSLSTRNEIFFETTEDIILNSSGVGLGEIRAIESGQIGNVGANLITEIVNPNAEIESVTNPEKTTGGREAETDLEARARARTSGEGLGKATVPSIQSALLKLPGVRAATVIENYLDDPDQYGTPMRSFQAFVLGGNDQEIGDTIFNTKAGGIRPYGTVEVTTNDIGGYEHKVYFSRATEVKIHLRVLITKNNAYPANGDNQVRTSLIKFIGGQDASGAVYSGLNMGYDVIESQLVRGVKVDGIEDITIELSRDGNTYSEGNIAIDPQEVAQTDFNIIEVTTSV